MKPHVICHMASSVDGRLAPSRWTESPDGSRDDWSSIYAAVHEALGGDAWIVGRVTMAEMTKAGPHPPAVAAVPERPAHLVRKTAGAYAIALDRSGQLHFDRREIDGDPIVVLLGRDVPDSHLAELADDGISYILSDATDIDLAAMLDALGRDLGIRRLLLEGGGGINGSFFAAGLVDELSLLVTPTLDGRSDSRAIVETGASGLVGSLQLSLASCETLEHGVVHLRYRVGSR